MLRLEFTAKFKRDYKRAKGQGRDLAKLASVLRRLQEREPLPERMRDHVLSGTYLGHRECHVEPDWRLIYRIDGDALTLTAVRTGSHAELFGL